MVTVKEIEEIVRRILRENLSHSQMSDMPDYGGINDDHDNRYFRLFDTTIVGASHAIADHNDTTATGSELETLTDGSNADSLHSHAAGGASQLTDLTDVNSSTPTSGNVLRADGVDWESATLSHGDLSGVSSDQHHAQSHTIASHSDTTATGAELDELTDGSTTSLHSHSSGGASQLTDLTDVNTSTPTDGNVLRADGSDWESTTLSIDDLGDVTAPSPTNNYVIKGNGTAWQGGYLTHSGIAGISSDQHHPQSHTIASHSDTSATGAELDTLTDGSNADALHSHSGSSSQLSDLSDVNTSTPTAGNVLRADGTDWESTTLDMDDLGDADTSTDPPSRNECLKWNGSTWVPAPYNYDFTYSCDSFDDGLSGTKLIGSGDWYAIGGLASFTASYSNGPPDTRNIQYSNNGAAYSTCGEMDGPDYTTGSNDSAAIPYPSARAQYIRFRLESGVSGDPLEYDYATSIYFQNNIKWGTTTKTSGYTSSDVEGLSGTAVSSDHTRTVSINCGASNYLLYAFPAAYTNIHTTGWLFNSVTCPFESYETVSYTNSAGYTENYKVYRSTNSNLGNSSLVTSTSSNLVNRIYYGTSTKGSGYTESDIEGLPSSLVSNTETRTYSINPGASEYVVVAYPTRLGSNNYGLDYETDGNNSIRFNSVGCGMNRETVSVTNVNGYTENYYVYISNLTNMPGSSLIIGSSTSGNIDKIYYGASSTASSITEATVEALDYGTVSNDNTQTWNTVTLAAGEYYWFCYPKRLGQPSNFWDNDTGFGASFESPETLSITNSSGWTEDYYCHRSTNPLGPGVFNLRTS